jgi:glycosyltransferase involved in cell wall biosynthesis
MKGNGITPLILTLNEEANLPRVLEKLRWADEIVIVDSMSTDRTVELARASPSVRLVQRVFDNHVAQWNFGLEQVKTAWVLSLDADYILSDQLIEELGAAARSLHQAGYYAAFRYCIAGRALRGSLYPPRLVLFRKEAARYAQDGHTQALKLSGTAGYLRGIIYHDDRKPLNAWLKSQDNYSRLEVEKLINLEPQRLGRIDRLRRLKWIAPLLTPIYCLFVKGLILDGRAGIYYTLQRTYAELLLSLRLFEREMRPRPAIENPTTSGSPQ